MALVLRNERATSILFAKSGNVIKYLGHGEEDFDNTIEDATTEQFLEVLDKSISQAENVLPDNVESHKTIFGLKENWIEDNKIKKEYLEKLKKASDELALEPIGFLVSSESVINLLQQEEGAPVTAVLVDMGTKFITVSLVKSGKIIETKSSEIHESAPFTVDTLLKHFQATEAMPSRVVIYGADDEEITQEFIGHPWSKSLPFLHLPQITTLPKDASIKAMLLGAATQMGAQLIYDSQNVDFDEQPKKISPEEFSNFEPVQTPKEFEEINAKVAASEAKEREKATGESVGTSEGATVNATNKPDYISPDDSLAYFGFAEGVDIAKSAKPEPEPVMKKVPDEVIKEEFNEIPEEEKIEEETKTGLVRTALLTAAKARVSIINFFKKFNPAGKSKRNAVLIIPAAIVILLLLGAFFLIFNAQATVTLLVNPKSDQKTTSVTFSSNKATDIASSVIASQPVSVSEDGSMSVNSSGTKDIGTAAKGSVTIFNATSNPIDLPSGTTITSPDNLSFTLDSDTSVASASGDASNQTPGTATVNITASDIGQNYNLPSGTKFSVGDYSLGDVAAKNDNAFSGGAKKTVTVVSKDDIQKLLDGLPKQLESKAKNDLQSKVTGDNVLLSGFTSETISNKSFDKNAGDQASSVTLKGTVDFQSLTYNASDMLSVANSLFSSGNTQLSKNNLSVNAKNITVADNGDVSADLAISANLLPKFDNNQIAKQIAGTSLTKARSILSSLSQVENVGIELKPSLPFLSTNLPGNPKNITIQITAK